MDIDKIKDALQDLIIRLQDAEKGYSEIEKATSNRVLKRWLKRYAKERHNMHMVLEKEVAILGGDAEVKTSLLGDLHRMFIDIKINSTSAQNEFDAVVTEIERGANVLINDYDRVLEDVDFPSNIRSVLTSQRALIENELNTLVNLKEDLNAIEA